MKKFNLKVRSMMFVHGPTGLEQTTNRGSTFSLTAAAAATAIPTYWPSWVGNLWLAGWRNAVLLLMLHQYYNVV
jgi:hypothetical protein